jgi:hypothetical protein
MNIRICSNCGNTSEQLHIYAVLNHITNEYDDHGNKVGEIFEAACMCGACEHKWVEVYNDYTGETRTYAWEGKS